MKRILWILGGVFIAVIVAMASVPLFVDVDQYRPEITAEANKRINGQLELGKLKLSLWGAIKIHAESIHLSVNGFPKPLVDTKLFHLEIPFSSLFTGKPEVVAVLKEPKIEVVKEVDGRMNVLELIKPVSAGAPTPTPVNPSTAVPSLPASESTVTTPAPPTASEPSKVPALLAGATIGVRIEKGNVHYLDKLSKGKYQVNDLELDVRNLGLGSTMSVKVLAPLKGEMPGLSFSGPVSLQGELAPVLVGLEVKSVKGNLDVDATKLEVEMPGKFHKSSKMVLVAKAKIDGDNKETLLRQLDIQFHEYKIHAKGRITAAPLTVKLDVNADPMRLESLDDFVPMVAAYDLKGLLNLNANIDLENNALRANGDVKVAGGSFFMKDMLKAPLEFQVQAGFSENSLNLARLGLSGPESEVQITGTVKNFLAPQFALNLTGKSLNLDKVLVLPEAAPKQAWISWIPIAYAAPTADVNPMAAFALNPIFAKASGTLTGQISKVIVKQAPLNQLQVRAQLQNMILKLIEAKVRTFDGDVRTTGEFDLKSSGLRYTSKGNVTGISGIEAMRTYFPKYQNTLEGKVSANWDVSGALYPATLRLRNLKGTAKMVAQDGALKSVDFQQSINSTMQKVPFLKGKKPPQIDNGFKTMTADLRFNNGVVQMEPFEMQPKGKGFVVKGKSTILESLEQESFFDVYDPQGLLPKEMQKPGKPAIALRLYGPLMAPKTDYEYTVKKLASTAGTNMAKDAATKALNKFINKGEEGKGDPLKDAAEKLKKKFKLF